MLFSTPVVRTTVLATAASVTTETGNLGERALRVARTLGIAMQFASTLLLLPNAPMHCALGAWPPAYHQIGLGVPSEPATPLNRFERIESTRFHGVTVIIPTIPISHRLNIVPASPFPPMFLHPASQRPGIGVLAFLGVHFLYDFRFSEFFHRRYPS